MNTKGKESDKRLRLLKATEEVFLSGAMLRQRWMKSLA